MLFHLGPGQTFPSHRTPTIDIGVILSGEMWVELDDGAEQLLRPGDILVQNGTAHAWHNRPSEPCFAAAVVIGADGPRASSRDRGNDVRAAVLDLGIEVSRGDDPPLC
jgi:quercetin dioxygenase-like cupin family protein